MAKWGSSVMQSDKFTALVRNAIGAAQSAALAANHQKLTAEHVLAALLKDDNMTVKMLLAKAGADSASLSALLKAGLDKFPQVTGSGAGQLQLDADLARIFASVEAEAKARHDQFIAVDLLLLAMTKSTGPVGKILKRPALKPPHLAQRLTRCAKAVPPIVTLPKIVMMPCHAIQAT
jgi:ATP-dependent Clp protease ATP-binding subunit ClpB